MKIKKLKKEKTNKVRAYFLSLILTVIAIFFVAGLAVVDINTRSVAGNTDGTVFAFNAGNSKIEVSVFNQSVNFSIPQFLKKALDFISNAFNSFWQWLKEVFAYIIE